MFCSRSSNIMINKIHKRALRVVFNDHTSDFKTLLQKSKDVCNHHRNTETLLIEIFKTKNDLAPSIMGSIFKRRNSAYNVRNFQEFRTERKRTVYIGLETLSYRSPQLWSLLPEYLRQINSLDQFERSARKLVSNTAQKMKFSITDFFIFCEV